MISSIKLTESLARAHQHWNARREQAESEAPRIKFSIAISRETGTYGAAIAREIGTRLGWPVYDRELLQRIADDIGVHRTLVESVDERQVSWLSECLGSLFAAREVNETVYFRRLVEALLSLASHGECVIVGRGATKVLPEASSLRVRIVAPREHRIQAVRQNHGVSYDDAAARVDTTDRERNRFVENHFHIDAADAANYDLVLNSARLSAVECADLILAALDRLRQHAGAAIAAAPAVA
jgi:cytidylate kinase